MMTVVWEDDQPLRGEHQPRLYRHNTKQLRYLLPVSTYAHTGQPTRRKQRGAFWFRCTRKEQQEAETRIREGHFLSPNLDYVPCRHSACSLSQRQDLTLSLNTARNVCSMQESCREDVCGAVERLSPLNAQKHFEKGSLLAKLRRVDLCLLPGTAFLQNRHQSREGSTPRGSGERWSWRHVHHRLPSGDVNRF